MPRTQYEGVLRCRVGILSESSVRIEWWDEKTKEVIWAETIGVPTKGFKAVSQIQCSGHFQPASGYYVDEFGLRHFRTKAEPGLIGVSD